MTKLKLNYTTLKDTSTHLSEHAESIADMVSGLDTYAQTLKNQEALTAAQFLAEINTVKQNAYKQKAIETAYARVLSNYVEDMQEILPAKNDDNDLNIDIETIDEAIVKIEAAYTLLNEAIDAKPVATSVCIDFSNRPLTYDWADSKSLSAHLEEQAKQARNCEKIEQLYSNCVSQLQGMEESIERLKSIKNDILLKAVEVDESYVSKFARVMDADGWQSETVDLVLDVAGFIPVIGSAVDLGHGVAKLFQGKPAEAAMYGLSAVPVVGDAAALTKVTSKGAKLASKGKKAKSIEAAEGIRNPVPTAGLGSTGRTPPASLNEKLAIHQVESNPLNGATRLPITLRDPRWPAEDGWIKMQSIVYHSDGSKTIIHFVYNEKTGVFDDFKFK
ncbi:MAG: hypothetical protein IJV62_01125 [Eggerthellaceae bacterium]|nr:hypothetical protein [Eggerthellaceae bacterium]